MFIAHTAGKMLQSEEEKIPTLEGIFQRGQNCHWAPPIRWTSKNPKMLQTITSMGNTDRDGDGHHLTRGRNSFFRPPSHPTNQGESLTEMSLHPTDSNNLIDQTSKQIKSPSSNICRARV
jgi:hypothetical protein